MTENGNHDVERDDAYLPEPAAIRTPYPPRCGLHNRVAAAHDMQPRGLDLRMRAAL